MLHKKEPNRSPTPENLFVFVGRPGEHVPGDAGSILGVALEQYALR